MYAARRGCWCTAGQCLTDPRAVCFELCDFNMNGSLSQDEMVRSRGLESAS